MNDVVVADANYVVDLSARERLAQFEKWLAEKPQFDCPVRHFFADGVYCREIFVPAGVVLTGHIHMEQCVLILSLGLVVIGEDGGQPLLLSAPYTRAVPAGTKKAAYALRDTVWTDCYANPDNEHDITVLEARLIAVDQADFVKRTAEKERQS
jgi:hypothetical protein